jgi:hypothetical protein
MHTVIVIAVGFALFGASIIAGYLSAGHAGIAPGALVFLPLWLCGAGLNLVIGVKKAGYSLAEEAPIFLFVFAIPALFALLVWWRFR